MAAQWGPRPHTHFETTERQSQRNTQSSVRCVFLLFGSDVVVVVVFLVNSIFIGKQNGNAGETEKALTTEPSESNRTAAANEIKVEKKNKKQKNETRTTTRPVR